jgi:FixJ family two-component response regulator
VERLPISPFSSRSVVDPLPAARVVHIVDDDEAFRLSVARLLQAAGYASRVYGSGREFLADTERAAGCLLLDVHMPGMSGFELAEHVAQQETSLPVVFMTGQPEPWMAERAARLGAVDLLAKPVAPAQLLEAIDRGLARAGRLALG